MDLDADTLAALRTAAGLLAATSTFLGVVVSLRLSSGRRRSGEDTLTVKLSDKCTTTTLPAKPKKQRKQTDRAMLALRLGILSIPLPILAIPAIVIGARALRELQGANGRSWSRFRARTGVALGSFMLLVLLVAFVGLA